MRLGLQAKYASSIFTVIGVVALLLSVALLLYFRDVLEHMTEASTAIANRLAESQLENHGLEFGYILAQNLSVPLRRGNTERIAELLGSARLHHSVEYALLFDTNGNLVHDGLAAGAARRGGEPLDHALLRRVLRADEPIVNVTPSMVQVGVPVDEGRERLGGVLLGFSTVMLHNRLQTLGRELGDIRAESMRQAVYGLVLMTVALLLLGTLLAVRLARHLSEPIRSLATEATRLGKGGSGRFTLRRGDELGELSVALAAMQESLNRTTVSKEYLADILDSLEDAVLVIGPDGAVQMANQTTWKLFGYRVDELKGQRIDRLVAGPRRCRGLIDRRWQDCERRAGIECLFRTRSGETLPVNVSLSCLRGEEGMGPPVVMAVQDISERRQLEDELRRYRENLEELVTERTRELSALNRELESFSYSVSHDLRTPLRAMNGFSQALVEDFGDTLAQPAREYLERIRKASESMSQMIDGLLTLSRVSRTELNREQVNLSALAADIVNELAETEPRRNVRADIQPDLLVIGDPALLHLLLQNLLVNAWKFTKARDEARIEVGRQSGGEAPAYFVRDNGVGFDMSGAERLFQPFQRLHSNHQYEGTGIGLATVQRIVARHGGRVWAESAPDQGATFHFTLPQPRDYGKRHEFSRPL